MARARIQTKTLRAPAGPEDGTRIYVGRRYPRGIKDGVLWDERIHDLGPSLGLHRAVLHEAMPLSEYKKRFRTELAQPGPRGLLRDLGKRCAHGETITLLCDHPRSLPDEDCHRFILKQLIEAEAARMESSGKP